MSNLAIMENGLINIYGNGEQDDAIVSGRELHEFLELSERFSKWWDGSV